MPWLHQMGCLAPGSNQLTGGHDVVITLLYFDGCPNWRVAEARLENALAQAGRFDVRVECRQVATFDQAEGVGFRGSPTVLVDGVDPFADFDVSVGLFCRVYRTADGLAGAPSLEDLAAVLR